MNTKNTLKLTAVTVVVALVAFMTHRIRAGANAPEDAGLFVPALRERINDVASVAIQGQTETFTLERVQTGWGMTEKGGYPVDSAKVRAYILEVAGAERAEEKTSDPARYERLGLQAVDTEGSSSTRVTFRTADGADIATVLVGDKRVPKGGVTDASFYARAGDDPASWLVDGDLTVDKTSKSWLDQTILEVARNEIVAARIEHADGEVVNALQKDPDAQYPELQDVPEGKEPTFDGVTARFTSALERLRLDDVQKDDAVEFPDPPQGVATFWTKDGLKVTVESAEIESKLYCRFSAAYDEAGAPGTPVDSGPPAPPADPEGGAPMPEEDPGKSPEEVQKQAAEIQERVAGWTYTLPTFKKTAFLSRMTELVRDIPEPTPPPDETPTDGAPIDGATPTDPPADATTGDGTEDESTEEATTGGGEGTTDPPPTDPPTDPPTVPPTGGGENEGGGGI